MNNSPEAVFQEEVNAVVSSLGYTYILEPSRLPRRSFWKRDLSSLFRGGRYVPDMIVQNGDKFVVLELKRGLILLGAVLQARDYADYFGSPVVVCLSRADYLNTPGSVRKFVDPQIVRVCAVDELDAVLFDFLGSPVSLVG